MSNVVRPPDVDDEAAEAEAIRQAVAESDANPRSVPHEEVRAWLMRLYAGEFDAEMPEPQCLCGLGGGRPQQP